MRFFFTTLRKRIALSFVTTHERMRRKRSTLFKCDDKQLICFKNYSYKLSAFPWCFFLLTWAIIWTSYAHFRITTQTSTIKTEINNVYNRGPMLENTYTQKGASACLIIKDDTPRLIEWIAYHYQVLPLKHLIITSDPSALTSPKEILDRWRNELPDLEIIEWNEENYTFDQTWAASKATDDAFLKAEYALVARQRGFYSSCASHFKSYNRTWVFIFDVDEYIVFNNVHSNDPTKREELQKYLSHMPDIKRARYRKHEWKTNHEKGLLKLRQELPIVGSKTVMDFIHDIRLDPFSPFTLAPSYSMPRLYHSTKESSSEVLAKADLPQEFNPLHFDTLRYFHHAEKGAFPWNRYGKSMFDVSRIPFEHLRPTIHEHQGVGYFDDYDSIFYSQSLLRVNHYLGSWEAYQRPGDDRRTKDDFKRKARINDGVTHDTQLWLRAFIENIGIEKATRLLHGVGDYSKKTKVPL